MYINFNILKVLHSNDNEVNKLKKKFIFNVYLR